MPPKSLCAARGFAYEEADPQTSASQEGRTLTVFERLGIYGAVGQYSVSVLVSRMSQLIPSLSQLTVSSIAMMDLSLDWGLSSLQGRGYNPHHPVDESRFCPSNTAVVPEQASSKDWEIFSLLFAGLPRSFWSTAFSFKMRVETTCLCGVTN